MFTDSTNSYPQTPSSSATRDRFFDTVLHVPENEQIGSRYDHMGTRPFTPLPTYQFDPFANIATRRLSNTTSFPTTNCDVYLPVYEPTPLLPGPGVAPSSEFSNGSSPALLRSQSPTPVTSAIVPRPDFTSREYIGLATAVVDINPFGAKHGRKGVMWEEVAKAVKAKGLFTKSSTDVIKNKMMALIKYQENPDSAAGTKIAREMSTAAGIGIAALLDRADMHVLQAMMEKSEERRELFEGKIVLALEESTKVYERTQDWFLSVLQDKLN